MKKKIKLTNLRHLETSKEEMKHLKGGDDPEQGCSVCSAGCDCTTACYIELNDREQNIRLVTNDATGNSALNKVWGAVTFGITRLFNL
jgi:natural product precursor